MHPLYLDYAGSTPIDGRVLDAMLMVLRDSDLCGNPHAVQHEYGRRSQAMIEDSRAIIATLLHADPSEILYTSGATEAINLALKGAAQLYQGRGKHIVTVKTEHKAVLETCQHLEKQGFQVTYLTPLASGLIDLQALSDALRSDTMLVSIMHVNNETGVIQDIAAIANLTAARGILLHVDAAQSLGKLPLNLHAIPIDLLSMTAHKLYGPQGIGALYVRKKPRVRVAAQIHGGGQEQGMRSGTLALHQVVGMGKACQLATELRVEDEVHTQSCYEIVKEIVLRYQGARINGAEAPRVPGILNVCFPGLKASDFMQRYPILAVAAGSACTGKGIEPSYVLRAMGLSADEAHTAIRFSYGRMTHTADIQALASYLAFV